MTQRQEFTVLKKFGDFELREYMPCVLAEVKVSADYSSAGSIAFRSLFSYIAQGNSRAEKIAMTAPVIAATQDTTIDDNQWIVSFVMPAGATFGDLPDPNDPRVVLRDLDTEICVATSFRGRANFYIWWRWSGDLDPSTTTYFTNNADAAAGQSIKYAYTDAEGKPKPLIQANGDKYQYAYIRMGFVEDYQVGRFPLDSQNLTMKIENDTYASNYLAYVFDEKHLSKEKFIPTRSWNSKGITTNSYIHHYTTDFGFIDEGSAFQDYSHLTYSMKIDRDKMFFYLKLLLPLLIVLIATLAALLVRQLASKAPLAIASTGLLTTLFAQQSYSQDLPPQSPLVLIDKIYLVGLLVILVVFLRVVMRTKKLTPGQAFDDTDLKLFMGAKSDLKFAGAMLISFGLATTLLILL